MTDQIDPRDFILKQASDNNWVFDLSEEKYRNKIVNEHGKDFFLRLVAVLTELHKQGIVQKRKSGKIYDVTSLGVKIHESGGFNSFEEVQDKKPKLDPLLLQSILYTNQKFTEALESSRKTQKLSLGIAFGTFIILFIQTIINYGGTQKIEGEVEVLTVRQISKPSQIEEMNQHQNTHSTDSLKMEPHRISKKVDSTKSRD